MSKATTKRNKQLLDQIDKGDGDRWIKLAQEIFAMNVDVITKRYLWFDKTSSEHEVYLYALKAAK